LTERGQIPYIYKISNLVKIIKEYKMKVIPIAFDSLGTRSMSCFVVTNDVNILIDPGVSLAPIRYNKPPHSLEWQRLEEHKKEIIKYSEKSDILTISHMHFDHFMPDNKEIYKNKILLMKHPTQNINRSQFGRAKEFLELIKNTPKQIEYADGKEFVFGETKIKFSPPCWHGVEKSKLGYVLMVSIDDGNTKIMHCSDVQGPVVSKTTELIIRENPDLIIIGGPLSYMVGFRLSWQDFEQAENNFIRILRETKTETIILDHHLLRDLQYKNKFKNAYTEAEKLDKKVITAAEFLGKPIEMLEARRKELYQKYPEKESVKKVRFLEE
jgi:predicted metallo-beta-lactamase superfamily hydrolase